MCHVSCMTCHLSHQQRLNGSKIRVSKCNAFCWFYAKSYACGSEENYLKRALRRSFLYQIRDAIRMIKKWIKIYLMFFALFAVLGFSFVVDVFWISTPLYYQSNDQEEFFIERTNDRYCLTLSLSTQGKLFRLKGTLPTIQVLMWQILKIYNSQKRYFYFRKRR